jgi:hypothetical protein
MATRLTDMSLFLTLVPLLPLHVVKFGSTSEPPPPLFNILIKDNCGFNYISNRLLFADDLKMYCSINNVDDCMLLQRDIVSVQKWCLDKGMKINTSISKTTVTSFTHKSINCNYKSGNKIVSNSQRVEDLGILLLCKFHLPSHVEYICSQGLKMLGLICYVTFPL